MTRLMKRGLFDSVLRIMGNIFRGAVLLLQHRADHVLHPDAVLPREGCTDRRFIQNRLQLSTGMIAHHFCQILHVDIIRDPLPR